MPSPLSADQLVRALQEEGVRVVEYKSWRTNNRNHVGSWGPVHGVMIHHTVTRGTSATVELCYSGRSDLPGPLCHGVIAKDGTVHLVGNGRANHAGSGDGDVLAAVIEERGLPADNETDTDGNTHFYGFECVNLGDGQDPWPPEQVEAVVRASAALCRAHGWGRRGATSVIGHLEWQPGKIDPRGPGISMGDVRSRVAERLKHDAHWNPNEEDEVPAFLALAVTEPFRIDAAGAWVSLAWDTEWADDARQHGPDEQSFANGGVQFNGVLQLQLSGLATGAAVQVRVVESGSDGEQRLPVAEGVGTEGSSHVAIPLCGRVGEGRRAKVMICHHNPDENPVTVARAELKAQVWA